MTNEKHRKELDEQALEAAAGGKPQHVFVPDLKKGRERDDDGGLGQTGDCGGGLGVPDDAASIGPVKREHPWV